MNQQRIKYLDDLRVIGIFAIILVHVASLWVTSTIVGVDWQKLASTIGNIGVPIFLMISGALLLNKNYPTVSGFYKRDFPESPFHLYSGLLFMEFTHCTPQESVI